MQLPFVSHFYVQDSWAGAEVCPAKQRSRFPRIAAITLVGFLFWQAAIISVSAQQRRMVIDGSIRAEGIANPTTTKIRILHQDGSIARTVMLYDPRNLKFGVRLSSQDEFFENEKILFRIVTSPQDSFLARFVTPPLMFRGTNIPNAAPTTSVLLFRNSLPTVYRWLPDTAINENQQLRYRFVAIDRDADTVRFDFRNAPVGAKIEPITGMFSWRPAYDQSGKYRVTFLISDGYEIDSSRRAFVTVRNVNRAPRFVREPMDTMIREADTLRTSVLAVDPDGDTLSYRPMIVPKGMEIDSTSGAIVWIPSYEQAGKHSLRLFVSDAQTLDTSRMARITVLNVNRPPVFIAALHDTVIREDENFSYSYVASDPDGDSVWYSLKTGPPGLTVSTTGFLTWKPMFSQSGSYTCTVSAHDQDTVTNIVTRIRVMNLDRPPSPNLLHRPLDRDTVRLALYKPVLFSWSQSFDPDSDDTIRYKVHFWGPQLDTIVGGQTDTILFINIKPHLLPMSTYRWTVLANDGYISVPAADTFSFRTSAGITGSTELLSQIPKTFYLEQSLPDPFNPMTTIRYALPERSYVKLAIYNMLGESLLVLVSGDKDAGVYDVTFDASEFTSGAYMFRLDAHPLSGIQFKDFVNTKKMFIVR